jgi:hypothetical protein
MKIALGNKLFNLGCLNTEENFELIYNEGDQTLIRRTFDLTMEGAPDCPASDEIIARGDEAARLWKLLRFVSCGTGTIDGDRMLADLDSEQGSITEAIAAEKRRIETERLRDQLTNIKAMSWHEMKMLESGEVPSRQSAVIPFGAIPGGRRQ